MAVDRREARREFKERKTSKGVFAVRCKMSSESWVSGSANLSSARTGAWFMLRNGMHHNKPLQSAWNTHGEAAFEFEILETFAEDMAPLELSDALRDRPKHWKRELSAAAV